MSYFLTELTKEKRTLWDQIKEKVDLKIGEKLAEYHVDRLKAEVFRVLESRFQESNNFGPADLKTVLDKRHIVFPHNWPTLGWSYELPLGILYWMPFMIAGYQQMIKENKQPKYVCSRGASSKVALYCWQLLGATPMATPFILYSCSRFSVVHMTSLKQFIESKRCSFTENIEHY